MAELPFNRSLGVTDLPFDPPTSSLYGLSRSTTSHCFFLFADGVMIPAATRGHRHLNVNLLKQLVLSGKKFHLAGLHKLNSNAFG